MSTRKKTPACWLVAAWLLGAALLAAPATAQAEWGVQGGLGLATITHPLAGRARWWSGAHVGGLLTVPVRPRLAGQLELHLARIGSRVDSATGTVPYQRLTNLYTISLPAVAKLFVGPRGWHLQLGGQANYYARVTETLRQQSGGIASSWTISTGDRDVSTRYHAVDVGLIAGIGLNLPAGPVLALRAFYGMRDLTADPAEQALRRQLGIAGARLRSVQLIVGWQFERKQSLRALLSRRTRRSAPPSAPGATS